MSFAKPLTAVEGVTAHGDGFRCARTVRADDPYLGGHFPGNPVFPGVFTVETVYQAARAAAGGEVVLVGVRSARFTSPVVAGDTLTVDFTLAPEDDRIAVDARCHVEGLDTARVRLHLGREAASA
ncbi:MULTISPECIES: 3-hydroxyacyl-ACP dehydratase FabZ family protein [unclassified Saccharothrix]|uniref:3-hydroxyacyl-ACP dehydratase FabZ family protein n=1 Tax=unclassified Saccharothrix TaxID=2593673 RepID=UPI00307CF2C6